MLQQPNVTLEPAKLPYPDKPSVTMDFAFQYWVRKWEDGTEEIKIESWYAPKESPSGGHACTVRLTYGAVDGLCSRAKARAGGYGYCKFSSAFCFAFRKLFPHLKNEEGLCSVNAAGESAVHNWLVSIGFTKVVGV